MAFWTGLTSNEIVSDTTLSQAVTAGYFSSLKTIQTTNKELTKSRALGYVAIDPTNAHLSAKISNELVSKQDFTACPTGYTWIGTLDGTASYTTISMPAQPPTTLVSLSGRTNNVYSDAGTKFFTSFNIDGTGTYLAGFTTPSFGGTYTGKLWSNPSGNTTDGPMNRCAVWPGPSTGATDNPTGTFIGFVQCITGLTVGATYYVGVSADNDFKISVNGTKLIDTTLQSTSGSTEQFNYWHVYPVVFDTPTATLSIQGYNIDSVAGFGVEIYNNTLAQLTGATLYSQLNVQFTSSSRKGTYVDVSDIVGYGYSCPAGYNLYYDTCTARCVATIYCGNPIPTLPTPTPTLSPTQTPTPSVTITPSITPTYTATPTVTYTSTPTVTPSKTPTLTPTPTVTPTLTPTPTVTLTPTPSHTLPTLNVSITFSTNPSCYGNSDGNLTASGTGGTGIYTYAISSNGGSSYGSYQSSATFNGLSNGTYLVRVKDSNGTVATSSSVTLNTTQVTASIAVSNVSCYGGSNGTIQVYTPSGGSGTGYQTSINGSTYYSVPHLFSSLSPNTYTIYIEDDSGCSPTTYSRTVSQPSAALSVSTTFTNATSGNNGSITATAAGGTSPYTYSLYEDTSSPYINSGGTLITSNSTGSFTSLGPYNYYVVVTDTNGCTTTSSVLDLQGVGTGFLVNYGGTQANACMYAYTSTNQVTIYPGAGGGSNLGNGITYYYSNGTPYNGFGYYYVDGNGAVGIINSVGKFTSTGNCA
jgi:hypothetical protein